MRPIHRTFFQTILGALFSELVEIQRLTRTPEHPARVDAIIEPQVQAFTLQSPSAPGNATYRASVIYVLRIYAADGELLGSWPVEGQGKGRANWLQGNEGVTEAVSNALRDVAAQIVMGIADQPTISKLLVGRRAPGVDTPLPAGAER